MPQLTRCSDSWLIASGSKAGGNQRRGVRDKGDAAEMGVEGVYEEGAAMNPGPPAVFRFQDNARSRCARAEEGASLGTQPDWGRRWGAGVAKALGVLSPGGREGEEQEGGEERREPKASPESPCGLARWEVALLALLEGAGPGTCGPASAFTAPVSWPSSCLPVNLIYSDLVFRSE